MLMIDANGTSTPTIAACHLWGIPARSIIPAAAQVAQMTPSPMNRSVHVSLFLICVITLPELYKDTCETGFSVTSSVYQAIIRHFTENVTSRPPGRLKPKRFAAVRLRTTIALGERQFQGLSRFEVQTRPNPYETRRSCPVVGRSSFLL
jgi:hypothetical protein